jgi:hypothetical protein
LEAAVLDCFAAAELSGIEVLEARAWIAGRSASKLGEHSQAIDTLKLQLDAIRTRLSRITDLLLDGALDQTVFHEKQKQLILQEAETKHQLAALEQDLSPEMIVLEKFVELVKSPSTAYLAASADKKRDLLKIMLSNLTVSGKNIEITLKSPFQVIAERQQFTNCRVNRGTCRTRAMLLTKLHLYFRNNPAALSESA